jgi:hypothetical protein
VLKKLGMVTAVMAGGMMIFGGMASAQERGDVSDHWYGSDESGQVGLANLNNADLLHNVNGTLGICDNNVNVLGVQVPVRDVLNGVGVPVLSGGEHEASGESPYNCASSGLADGGSIQDN